MDLFTLKMFFHELLELSYSDLKPGWGNPCSHLLKDMMLRQSVFLDKIMGDYTGGSHEYRLNDAGLKMYWLMRREDTHFKSNQRMFKCTISGDQAKEYPMFVAQAEALILSYNFNKYPRFRRKS